MLVAFDSCMWQIYPRQFHIGSRETKMAKHLRVSLFHHFKAKSCVYDVSFLICHIKHRLTRSPFLILSSTDVRVFVCVYMCVYIVADSFHFVWGSFL